MSTAQQASKRPQRETAFTRRVTRVRTTTIKGTIKNSIEIPSKDSRDRRVNMGVKIIQKEVMIRVAVRTIDGTDMESLVLEGELALEETINRIRP